MWVELPAMKSLQGHLLVASPYLPDPNFYRSVVLIVQHDQDHAFGLVLNRPGPKALRDAWSKVSETPCEHDQPIRVGGPLEGPLMAVHTQREHAEAEIVAGIYFATQRHHLYAIVGQSKHPFVIFSGYSGWGAGQLEQELRVGGWMTMQANSEMVFAQTDQLWRKTARAIGDEILASLKVKRAPEDPSLN
jgi:putative transcriptional regulator